MACVPIEGLRLTAKLNEHSKPLTTTPESANATGDLADSLLTALHAAVTLEWSTTLRDGRSIRISAELDTDTKQWPPTTVSCHVDNHQGAAHQLDFSSFAAPGDLDKLLKGALAVSEPTGTKPTEPDQVLMESVSLELVPGLDLVCSDMDRRVAQPRCMHQWHGGACGHHALWNAQCILERDVVKMSDEPAFWCFVFDNVNRLIAHGESVAKWPRSRFLGGVVDGCHLRYLVDSSPALKDHVSVVEVAFEIESAPGLARLRAGSKNSEAFLLGAQTHWYCAVAQPAAAPGQPRLWICDSYNTNLATLQTSKDVDGLVQHVLEIRTERAKDKLKKTPDWCHRTDEDVETAIRDGIPEWWKGYHRSQLFWRYKSRRLQEQLLTQEYSDISSHIKLLLEAMAESEATTSDAAAAAGGS